MWVCVFVSIKKNICIVSYSKLIKWKIILCWWLWLISIFVFLLVKQKILLDFFFFFNFCTFYNISLYILSLSVCWGLYFLVCKRIIKWKFWITIPRKKKLNEINFRLISIRLDKTFNFTHLLYFLTSFVNILQIFDKSSTNEI